MSTPPLPVLEPRRADAFVAEARARLAAYVPGLRPADEGPGAAVVQVYARYLEALADRINQAPDKNKLAFFDRLGIELLPAQAARAPVAFTAIAAAGDSRVPEGTRLGAKVAGRSEPLIFETEQAIGLAVARLAEVVTVWPGSDAYAVHTAAALRGDPFTLFDPLQPVRHELYLAHDVHFALAGRSTVEVQVELMTPGGNPLDVVWEYWDGEMWRGFKAFVPASRATDTDSVDGTSGFTRSGVVRLVADCATTKPTRVSVIEARWIRARTNAPLVQQTGVDLPELDRVQIRTIVHRELPAGACASHPENAGILADNAYAGETKLDLTKAVQPLGARPTAGSVFLLSCEEIFAKPGAEVTLCFRKVLTPEEKADQEGAKFEFNVVSAQNLVLDAVRAGTNSLLKAFDAVRAVRLPTGLFFLLTDAQLDAARQKVVNARNDLTTKRMEGIRDVDQAAEELITLLNQLDTGLVRPDTTPWDFLFGTLGGLADSDIFNSVTTLTSTNEGRIDNAAAAAKQSAQYAEDGLDALEEMTPFSAVMAAGGKLPSMADPVVAWEYWNGRRWSALAVGGTTSARTFRGDGPVTFTVPDDIEPSTVNGVEGRWIRARLTSGGYGIVRTVSWKDEASQRLNFLPIVEYRPPTVDVVRLGYTWRSRFAFPEHCVTYNDFRYADQTDNARARGDAFEPFSPVDDRTPALYLGFDRALPADVIGIYFDIAEVVGDTDGPALTWEYHDGNAWRPVRVNDQTHRLALPGMADVLWPGVPPLPAAMVISAQGTLVRVQEARDATAFAPGDELWLAGTDGSGELVTVASIERDAITVTAALSKQYNRATIGFPTLPRFGTPRTWLRARLTNDGPPRRSLVRGIFPNAVWASQLQTVENELLGSGSGQRGQVLFARNLPVLEGETLEVRELVGGRAHVEEPMLRRELALAGIPDSDIRVVKDPRTGHTSELWVRWRPATNALFSPPDARVYSIERTRGRFVFGANGAGMALPPGTDNVRLRRYRSGGGTVGNVALGGITQILAGVLAERVTNVRAAEGGADSEPVDRVLSRAPHTIRHRRQAISAADYEDLATEASPAVAVARALPTTHPSGRFAPGWVTVRIVPHSTDPRPMPSFGLRDRVQRFIAARAPSAIANQVAVIDPLYLPIGVEAVVSPVDPAAAADVLAAVREALMKFLHPLTGGPERRGWPWGRDVYLSDIAAVLENVNGVDYIETLSLLADGTPTGEQVYVPAERMVVAGDIRLTLSGSGR
jgi:uncharacterized phage protein gp47/JayE